MQKGQTDSSIFYNKQIISGYKKLNAQSDLVVLYTNMGFCYSDKNDTNRAFSYLDSALSIVDEYEVPLKVAARLYYSYGLVYQTFGEYEKSNSYLLKNIQLLKGRKDSLRRDLLIYSTVELAKNFYWRDDFEKAIDFASDAIDEINDSQEFRYAKISSLNSRGTSYLKLKNDSSLADFKEALRLSKELQIKISIATSNANISSYYLENEIYDSVRTHLFDALEFYENSNILNSKAAVRVNTGFYYLKINSLEEARKYLESGTELAEELKFWQYAIMGVKNLIKLYEKTGEKDKAIASYKKWIDFTNEQNKEIHIKERVKLATEYQLSLHDIENRLLREEALVKDQHISFQRKLNFILIGGLVVVAFLSCLLFYYLRKSRRISAELQRKNLELNELNEKKNEILSIIGHDLRGPIANMLYL